MRAAPPEEGTDDQGEQQAATDAAQDQHLRTKVRGLLAALDARRRSAGGSLSRGRRRGSAGLLALSFLQGVVDEAHGGKFLGETDGKARERQGGAARSVGEGVDVLGGTAGVPVVDLVGIADERGEQRLVAKIVDDAGNSLAAL